MAIQDQVIADILTRKELGITNYGTALFPYNGRDSLKDLYEEILDAAMYLKQMMIESENSVLVDYQIKALCANGLIYPYNPEHINPTSLDICIGDTSLVETLDGFSQYDLAQHTQENPYHLQPGEFILTSVLESVKLPENICADIKLKSSRAREGLGHLLAGWVDSGFHGTLTLELKNYTNHQTIPIYPGLRVAQLILYHTKKPKTSYMHGRYAGYSTVVGSLDKE